MEFDLPTSFWSHW